MAPSVAADVEGSPLLQSQSRWNRESSANDCDESIWKVLERRREHQNLPSRRRKKWMTLVLGQIVALLCTAQNAASFTLEYGMGKFFPMFLMFYAYIILAIHLLFNRPSLENEAPHRIPFTSIQLRTPWWYYLCLSIFDVGTNFLTLLALKHTSLTSATLLGSLTVPSTMLVCRFLLAKVYKPQHYLGVVLCMTGGILTVWSDVEHTHDQKTSSHPHSYYGDVLAVVAALFYGIGDAAGEFWTKHVDRKEYLGMLGLFGSIFTLILSALCERDAVYGLFADGDSFFPTIGVIIVYVPLLATYYVSSTLFLVSSDATLLNLSLQSSNLWAIIFSVVAFRETPSALFYAAVVFVVAGVFVYEGNTSPNSEPTPTLNKSTSSEYQSLETVCIDLEFVTKPDQI